MERQVKEEKDKILSIDEDQFVNASPGALEVYDKIIHDALEELKKLNTGAQRAADASPIHSAFGQTAARISESLDLAVEYVKKLRIRRELLGHTSPGRDSGHGEQREGSSLLKPMSYSLGRNWHGAAPEPDVPQLVVTESRARIELVVQNPEMVQVRGVTSSPHLTVDFRRGVNPLLA
jgi:hypothetical protein